MKLNGNHSLEGYYKIAFQKAMEMSIYYGICIDSIQSWKDRTITFTIDGLENQEFGSLQEVEEILKNKNFI